MPSTPLEVEQMAINVDLLRFSSSSNNDIIQQLAARVLQTKRAYTSDMIETTTTTTSSSTEQGEPHFWLLQPIFDSLSSLTLEQQDDESAAEVAENNDKEEEKQEEEVVTMIVGFWVLDIPWKAYLLDILPDDVQGLDVVVKNQPVQTTACSSGINNNDAGNNNAVYTFSVNGPQQQQVEYLGAGDYHDVKYNHIYHEFEIPSDSIFFQQQQQEQGQRQGQEQVSCDSTTTIVTIYASQDFVEPYESNPQHEPARYAMIVMTIFGFTLIVFMAYDWAVQRRRNAVLQNATKTQALVSSLFPKNVQERILREVEEQVAAEEKEKRHHHHGHGGGLGGGSSNHTSGNRATNNYNVRTNRTKQELQNFLKEDNAFDSTGEALLKSKPIA
jgi:hypothetical protein